MSTVGEENLRSAEENLANKIVQHHLNKKKISQLLIKHIVPVSAVAQMLRTIVAWFGIDLHILSYCFGLSLSSWVLYYALAEVNLYCYYHRALLWYVMADNVINVSDYYIHFPVSDIFMLSVNTVIFCIGVFAALFIHMKVNGIPMIWKHNRRKSHLK